MHSTHARRLRPDRFLRSRALPQVFHPDRLRSKRASLAGRYPPRGFQVGVFRPASDAPAVWEPRGSCEMVSELVVAVVLVAAERGLFQRAVHALDLAIRPGVLWLCEPVIAVAFGAGVRKSMGSEDFASGRGIPRSRACEQRVARRGEVVPSSVKTYGFCRGRAAMRVLGSLPPFLLWLSDAVRRRRTLMSGRWRRRDEPAFLGPDFGMSM